MKIKLNEMNAAKLDDVSSFDTFNSASYQTDNLKTVYNIANGFALDASKEINLKRVSHTNVEIRCTYGVAF